LRFSAAEKNHADGEHPAASTDCHQVLLSPAELYRAITDDAKRLLKLVVIIGSDVAAGAPKLLFRVSRMDNEIRVDSDSVNRSTGWRQISGRRQLDGAAGRERHHRLHGRLTIGRFSDKVGSVIFF
jgi:hypothetical protein